MLGVERRTSTVVNTVTEESVRDFGRVSGDLNPLHFDEEFAKKTLFGKKIAHGMLSASFASAALFELGTKNETVVLLEIENMKFHRPVKEGDVITTTAEIVDEEGIRKTVECMLTNQHGKLVISGRIVVNIYPREEKIASVEIVAHTGGIKKVDTPNSSNGKH